MAATTGKRAATDGKTPAKTSRKSAGPATPAAPRARRKGGARNLVIVESPAKARTIEGILGPDYRVIASIGHVRDLPLHGYGVASVEKREFEPKYVVPKDKATIVAEIAEAARDAEHVYLSTDPDREGEAISWHIMEAADIPPEKVSRVVFHEITRPAIQAAFQHPRDVDMNLVDAQQTRRVLDRLIGFPLTWFVQGKVSRGASAGRVQSVALRLVVEREREIQAFTPVEYWSIHALLAKAGTPFTADLVRLPGQRSKPTIGSEAAANGLLETFRRCSFAVGSVKRGERSRPPMPPFTTSTFQQAANNRLGLGASRAMAIAQQLYEGVQIPGEGATGLITYMRTDSLNVSPIARGEARQYIARRWGAEYVPAKERFYRTRTRGAQEAHEAIRPTGAARAPETLRGILAPEQMRVYTLIWQRFIASQAADARYATIAAEIEAREGAAARGTFRAGVQRLIFPGHLAVYGADAADLAATDEDEEAEGSLPELSEGDALERRSVEGKQHFTEPPPRFTEASLIRSLEELGIGRPSTYATIVQTVQKREYVGREGRALVPRELGFVVNDLLVEHLGKYVAPGFTAEMEEDLDDVAEGTNAYDPVVRGFWEEFEPKFAVARENAPKVQEETDVTCTACGQAKMVVRWGRNGKFFACPRFPECKNAMPLDSDGTPVATEGPELTPYLCPKDGAPTVRKSGPFGPYVDCVNREAGKCDFRAGVPVGVPCPEEPTTGQLVEKQRRSGKTRGTSFYGCWNFPLCSYTTNSIEPGKIAPARPSAERDEANRKSAERSARGKAAFARRRATTTQARRRAS